MASAIQPVVASLQAAAALLSPRSDTDPKSDPLACISSWPDEEAGAWAGFINTMHQVRPRMCALRHATASTAMH